MNQFLVDPDQVRGDRLSLLGEEARHAVSVLRFRAGDVFWATDGRGRRWKAVVESAAQGSVEARVLQAEELPRESPRITVALGMLKKRDRMEFALEKLTELGAAGILLVRTDHAERDSLRIDRAELIVKSALKQSMGAWMPSVGIADSLRAACESGPWSAVVLADETLQSAESAESLTDAAGDMAANENADAAAPGEASAAANANAAGDMTAHPTAEQDILLLIGPEGGFSTRETQWLDANVAQLTRVSLGTRRLRAETAAIAGILKLHWMPIRIPSSNRTS